LRIKEQEKRLTLHERDDDDDDEKIIFEVGLLFLHAVNILPRNIRTVVCGREPTG
jgi:hypothetical protein